MHNVNTKLASFKIFFCLVFSLCMSSVYAREITLKTDLGLVNFRDTTVQKVRYIDARVLEPILKTKLSIQPIHRYFTVNTTKTEKWFFFEGNPFIRVDTLVYNLSHPVLKSVNYYFLPLRTLLILLESEANTKLYIDNFDTLRIGSPAPILQAIAIEKRSGGAWARLTLSDSVDFEVFNSHPNFLLNLKHTRLHDTLPHRQNLDSPLRVLVMSEERGFSQLSFSLAKKMESVEVEWIDHTTLSIVFREPVPEEPKKETPPPITPSKNGNGKVVIIDPGHGGKDPGANYNQSQEKKITLAVGIALKKQLENQGYKALLTRDSDTFISLVDRPKFAAQNGGNLFISLHCNAVANHKKGGDVSGFVAYILREGESEEDKALARRENEAIQSQASAKKIPKTELSSVDWILLEHELNLYTHQSEQFAEQIVDNFAGGKIVKHRTGAHQAGFFVLVGAFMPAVLFEMGFITNETDRAYMDSKDGAEDIAKKLTKSIHAFFMEQDKRP